MGVERIVKWRCSTCQQEHDEAATAEACYARGFKPEFVEGDVVRVEREFSWYDGRPGWVVPATTDPEHPRVALYHVLYVVTFVDGAEDDGHRPRYHLRSLAFKPGTGYNSGWTTDEHYPTRRHTGRSARRLREIATRAGWLGLRASYLL